MALLATSHTVVTIAAVFGLLAGTLHSGGAQLHRQSEGGSGMLHAAQLLCCIGIGMQAKDCGRFSLSGRCAGASKRTPSAASWGGWVGAIFAARTMAARDDVGVATQSCCAGGSACARQAGSASAEHLHYVAAWSAGRCGRLVQPPVYSHLTEQYTEQQLQKGARETFSMAPEPSVRALTIGV
jgi:hypothetical protein